MDEDSILDAPMPKEKRSSAKRGRTPAKKKDTLLACKKCNYLLAHDPKAPTDVCPLCGGAMSKEWQGYLIIMDPARSEIARKMGITKKGKYALRVR